ncbi:hypothetical protein LCGC14_0516880 [marine sediment metagenome]|uniref:Uncharacterized protein n=1 Tax=marine sediment metagenome TaxID=412755 RepID=A0A0F9S4D9_9ZZZZ
MTDYISFTIPGKPIPMGRGRIATTKRGKPYIITPMRTRVWQNQAIPFVRQAMAGRDIIKTPVAIETVFYFAPPKSWSQKQKTMALGGELWAISKWMGDVDNLLKQVLEICTGVVFEDDIQVVEATSERHYSKNEGTLVNILDLGKI